jgi:hypothetical protein
MIKDKENEKKMGMLTINNKITSNNKGVQKKHNKNIRMLG